VFTCGNVIGKALTEKLPPNRLVEGLCRRSYAHTPAGRPEGFIEAFANIYLNSANHIRGFARKSKVIGRRFWLGLSKDRRRSSRDGICRSGGGISCLKRQVDRLSGGLEFDVGKDERHISTTDADGVALAAIQGLNRKLKDQESEIIALKEQVVSLRKRLEGISRGSKESPNERLRKSECALND
jgi:hypothetical protein